MSGFIGTYKMFITLQEALDIVFVAQHKKEILHTLYPLTKRNNFTPFTKEEIKDVVAKLPTHIQDLHPKLKDTLEHYLFKNIDKMF